MKRIVIILALLIFIANTPAAFAHPGRTASDGCHYCRTNCDRWGVVWNERHCHGGYAPPARKIYVAPTNVPIPTFIPSTTSTITPTIKPTKATTKVKKTVNKVSKVSPTPTPKKSFWRWLFGF